MSDMMDIYDELDQVIDSIAFLEDVVLALTLSCHEQQLSVNGLCGMHQLVGNIVGRARAIAEAISTKLDEERACVA